VQEANEAGFMLRINHPDDLDQSMRDHRRLLDGESLHIEHRILTNTGETRWVERRSSPVYDKEGTRVEYIYGVVHDITARKESEQRLIESELKALRAQMNPHFFFNSLNAIQSFIITNEKKLAADYLSKFARLMRLILENSKSPIIEIRTEIELLSLYIELEAIRFDQRFESTIDIGPEVDTSAEIPSMLLQPYVENAIRHGLVHKGEGGKLSIKLHCIDHQLLCTIEDNGIGRGKAEEIRQRQGRSATSMGMQITKDRLDILSAGRRRRASVTITDLFDAAGSAAGTRVEITIPIDES
jgi:LytS/YehU family sensor histidine kinase